MVNPCFCGCSLKTATLVVAIIDMIIAGFSAVIILVLGYVAIENALAEGALLDAGSDSSKIPERDQILYGSSVEVTAAIFGTLLVLCIIRFYFALVLQRGSDKEDPTRCKMWMGCATMYLLMNCAAIIGNYFKEHDAFENVGIIIGIVYIAFSIWVVYEFLKEMQAAKTSRTNSVV